MIKKKIDLILFDFDGTILDSETDIVNSVNLMLKKLGLKEKKHSQIAGFIGTGVKQLIIDSLESPDPARVQEAIKIYKDFYSVHMFDNTSLYPGVVEVLEHFKGKKKVIISNKSSEFIRMGVDKFGISKYFLKILSGDDENCRKPSPCPIINLIKEFNVSPRNSIIIGDSLFDIKSGKDAGILTCGVTYGIGKKEDVIVAKPDFVIDDIVKLKDILM